MHACRNKTVCCPLTIFVGGKWNDTEKTKSVRIITEDIPREHHKNLFIFYILWQLITIYTTERTGKLKSMKSAQNAPLSALLHCVWATSLILSANTTVSFKWQGGSRRKI